LESVADCIDDGNSRDRHNIHGLRGSAYPGSAGKHEPSQLASRIRDHDFGVIGVLLALLHGIEAALWGAAYWWLGALNSLGEAMLYSVDSISTRGASGLTLEHGWRMMGALEAVDGMLLFGISTAYVFAVMQAYWAHMILPHGRSSSAFERPNRLGER
jgi:hypothetical protein